MSVLKCAIHNVDEDDAGAFKACGECWHVFMTEQELIDEDYNVRFEMENMVFDSKDPFSGPILVTNRPVRREINADKIYTCPLCYHDF